MLTLLYRSPLSVGGFFGQIALHPLSNGTAVPVWTLEMHCASVNGTVTICDQVVVSWTEPGGFCTRHRTVLSPPAPELIIVIICIIYGARSRKSPDRLQRPTDTLILSHTHTHYKYMHCWLMGW